VDTITTRPTPIASAGLIGLFSRVPPSQYQPRASAGSCTSRGGKNTGIEQDASTCSVDSRAGA
jgi:hypothetical protein